MKTRNFLSLWHIFLVIGLWVTTGCNPPSPEDASSDTPPGYVFRDIQVVDVVGGTVAEAQDVWVQGETIRQIGKALKVSSNTQEIDGAGKYLMPGLAEMHAHIPVPKGPKDSLAPETLFLYLANGITTIRGMLGDPFHLQLREQVQNHEVRGPRIYTSGPSLNGNSAPDVATAVRMVRDQQAAGYDFLKLHPGLTLEVYDSLVATANKVRIPYAGHVSIHVGIRHAIETDYASVDHLDGYLEGLVPESAGVAPDQNGFFGFNFTDLVDLSLLPQLAADTRAHGVAVVSTQSLLERWTSPEKPAAIIQQPEMKYMHPRTLQAWERQGYAFQASPLYTPERYQTFIEIRRKIIRALRDADVLLLLGSDAPQVFNVPGFSIHHELKAMVDAGLTPQEALMTGTLNPARYFGQASQWGTIEAGKVADMVLLAANPLEDVSHASQPQGVMYRGTWMNQADIDAGLRQIASHYANLGEKAEN